MSRTAPQHTVVPASCPMTHLQLKSLIKNYSFITYFKTCLEPL